MSKSSRKLKGRDPTRKPIKASVRVRRARNNRLGEPAKAIDSTTQRDWE